MRPCDECVGRGEWLDDEVGDEQCGRCEFMPWLPCPNHSNVCCSVCGGRGKFKPDPVTVQWWCQSRGSCWPAIQHTVEEDGAKCGWVERPTRLETIE